VIANVVTENELLTIISPVVVVLVAMGIALGRFHGRISKLEEWARLKEKRNGAG